MIVSGCYAGKGAFKNEWTDDVMKNLGPLPRGQYTISLLHLGTRIGNLAPRRGRF